MRFAPHRRAIFHLSSGQMAPHHAAPAALASLLFDPPEPQDIGTTQCFATFLPFSRACIFFLLTFSLLRSSSFFSSLHSSLILLTSAFSSVHIVGSLTSRLPSMIALVLTKHIFVIIYHCCFIIKMSFFMKAGTQHYSMSCIMP